MVVAVAVPDTTAATAESPPLAPSTARPSPVATAAGGGGHSIPGAELVVLDADSEPKPFRRREDEEME